MIFYDWHLDEHTNEPWVYADNVFTQEECKKILSLVDKKNQQDGETTGYGNDTNIRRSKILYIESNDPNNYWIFQRCSDVVKHLNDKFFQFNIDKLEALQIGEYDSNNSGCFKKHVDMEYKSQGFRKLSFSVQLSNIEEYEGGDLRLYGGDDYDTAPKKQGTIIGFPSYVLHEVTPVTSGVRYSLVGWAQGPKFK
jgi:PKHD-type hydroxylase